MTQINSENQSINEELELIYIVNSGLIRSKFLKNILSLKEYEVLLSSTINIEKEKERLNNWSFKLETIKELITIEKGINKNNIDYYLMIAIQNSSNIKSLMDQIESKLGINQENNKSLNRPSKTHNK